MSNVELILLLFFGIVVLGAAAALARDVLTRRNGSGAMLLLGFAVLFAGERMAGEGTSRLVLSGAAVLVIAASIALRVYAMNHSEGARKHAHQQALLWSSVSAGSLFWYALSLDGPTAALNLDDDGVARWIAVMWSLFPITALVGLLPTLLIDRMIGLHPVQIPSGATDDQQWSGLAAALAICLLFPVNFLASAYDIDADVAYFRTTRAGESTLAIVRTLGEPIEAYLFFPAGNDVRRELEPYFESLAEASEGRFDVIIADQAVEPELAKDLKVNDNGQIVFKQGESTETFKLNLEMDRARRDLRKLDSRVQKHLLRLTRGSRNVYFLVHHGGVHWRGQDRSEDPLKEIRVTKRIFEEIGLKVETLDVADSTQQIPDDAAVVVIGGAAEELYPEEVEALSTFFENGGSLFIAIDPEGARHPELLARLGLDAGPAYTEDAPEPALLLNAESIAAIKGSGINPKATLVTNKYGSHAATKQLSRYSARARMILPGAVAIEELDGDAAPSGPDKPKVSVLVRSPINTWADLDGDYEADEDEEKKVYPLASAVELDRGEEREGRAIVLGTANAMADMFTNPRLSGVANAAFSVDAFKWLVHDEEIVGKIENEEDTKVVQTEEDSWVWSLAIIGLVPGLVLTAGLLFLRSRQERRQ